MMLVLLMEGGWGMREWLDSKIVKNGGWAGESLCHGVGLKALGADMVLFTTIPLNLFPRLRYLELTRGYDD